MQGCVCLGKGGRGREVPPIGEDVVGRVQDTGTREEAQEHLVTGVRGGGPTEVTLAAPSWRATCPRLGSQEPQHALEEGQPSSSSVRPQ